MVKFVWGVLIKVDGVVEFDIIMVKGMVLGGRFMRVDIRIVICSDIRNFIFGVFFFF